MPEKVCRTWLQIYPWFQEKKKETKDAEKEKKRKRRKTETDSEDEEKEDFQIFCVEERLTVAHRPNYQGSSTTSGTLYPALVRGASSTWWHFAFHRCWNTISSCPSKLVLCNSLIHIFHIAKISQKFKCQVVLLQEMMNCLMEARADRKDRQFILFIFRFSSHWSISQTCLKQKSSQSSSLATTN